MRIVLALALLITLPSFVSADAWDCTVPESHDDTANGTFQIYIVCELPENSDPLAPTTTRFGPSLDAIDRAIWETGTDDDKALLISEHVESMKAEFSERTAPVVAPILAQSSITSTAAGRAGIDKEIIQARIDAMDDSDEKDRLQERLDRLP